MDYARKGFVTGFLLVSVLGMWTLFVGLSGGLQLFLLDGWTEGPRVDRETFVPFVTNYLDTGQPSLLADFSPREQRHLADVRELFRWLFALTAVSIIGCVFMRPSPRAFHWALVTVILFGLAVSLGFEPSFIRFHELVFTNRDWYLPTDAYRLTRIYPTSFFSVAWTVIIVGSVVTLFLGSLWRRRTATINT